MTTTARLISSFTVKTAFVRPLTRISERNDFLPQSIDHSIATWQSTGQRRPCSSSSLSWSRLQASNTNNNNNNNNVRNGSNNERTFSSNSNESYNKPRYPNKTAGSYDANGKRQFSSYNNNNNDNWQVPKSIEIPVEKIDLSFTKSSGAGGQNVNKVNTKVELRFEVLEADWLPLEVRERLYQQQRSRINKKGFLSLQAQEHRTQEKNRKTAVSKLQTMILEAWERPKERKMRTGISRAAKARNVENKRRRSNVKESRKSVSSRDW
ncbi:hydrolase ICT1, mitochondrial [Seminavis robusta]|uniref:Hydrolase ICT1, mitochondrial n=1 Tax=Seminavis robusta TaxID=568900 RepID=A0A9N8ERY9_9STRA|nr:hydrolase ICT1, mitochondrial [Seminavis robusta]|eukprot:Sro1533_g280330.1 hydrolase ICT1, mitochondrial (266) ;mRNA; r:9254-10051